MALPSVSQSSPFSRAGGAATPKGILQGLNFSPLTATPAGLGALDAGRIWWRDDLNQHEYWDGTTNLPFGGASTLQAAYTGGSDILVNATLPVQIRDNGAALDDGGGIFTGLYADMTGGLALAFIGDGSTGIPGLAGGQQVILDTAVTFPGGTNQIEFGVDLTVAAGSVITPAAILGVTTGFVAGGIINVKGATVGADNGPYTIVGVANGLTTNSIAIVVDSLTQVPPTFTSASGTAKIFNQSFGLNAGLQTETLSTVY